MIFYSYMAQYYRFLELNTYVDIRVDRVSGQQCMDAGRIVFAEGTHVEVKKSMGFKNVKTYCVAPIVFGNTTLESYDYWAVGSGCCSGIQADFHCANYNDPTASSGLRLMDEDDKGFYRLAVQQAEAVHKITAGHPLFFEWVPDGVGIVEELSDGALHLYRASIAAYLVFQGFLVVLTGFAFSTLPHF
jgi:hypothetical protein